MVALPNIGGALYSTPQSLADAHYYMPCTNAAKTRNQLKFGGVLQTNETISAASWPKFTILRGHVTCDSLGQFKRLLKTYLFGGWDRGAL